ALAIPAHHHFRPVFVPHHRDRIEPAIQGTVLVDAAPAGLRLKRRALVSLALGHHRDLRARVIRKSVRRDPARDSRLNFLPREVGTQRAVALRKPAADVAGEANPAGHDLLDDTNIHRWSLYIMVSDPTSRSCATCSPYPGMVG